MDTEITIADSRAQSRYEARNAAGHLMGFVNYRLTDTTIAFLHAETFPDYRGQGVASKIATKSLDDARHAGLKVKPACPYYQQFVAEHDEYSDLVSANGPDSL